MAPVIVVYACRGSYDDIEHKFVCQTEDQAEADRLIVDLQAADLVIARRERYEKPWHYSTTIPVSVAEARERMRLTLTTCPNCVTVYTGNLITCAECGLTTCTGCVDQTCTGCDA